MDEHGEWVLVGPCMGTGQWCWLFVSEAADSYVYNHRGLVASGYGGGTPPRRGTKIFLPVLADPASTFKIC